MSHPTHALFGAMLALSLGTAASVSHAVSLTGAPIQQSMSVRYGDLSLDRPADVKTLYRRIKLAADQVCGQREITGSHLPLPAYEHCYDIAVSQAVTTVASPALTAYYQSLPGHLPVQAPSVAQR